MGETDVNYAKAEPTAKLHDSMTLSWMPTEFVPRKRWNREREQLEWRMNLFRRRTLPAAPLVHHIAWQISAYRLPPDAVSV